MAAHSTPTPTLSLNLAHHFLIAMPHMPKGIFARSVIYVCDHNEDGALGLVINKPSGMVMGELFDKVSLPLMRADIYAQPVLQGGPVQQERGFVLHEKQNLVAAFPLPAEETKDASTEKDAAASEKMGDRMADSMQSAYASTLTLSAQLEITTSKDVLEALSNGAGPKQILITLGYSAWSAGQLEEELADNAWLTAPASTELLFETPIEQRYAQALSILGVTEISLSAMAGHD